jgi:signal transduction histidine kinase
MAKHNFTIFSSKPERHDELKIKQYAEIGFLYFVLMGLTFVLHFEQYWFAYGFFSLYVAIRFGFGQAVLMNGFIFLISYILPLLLKAAPESNLTVDMRLTNIHIGSSLLYLFSAITGRVVSDLKKTEEKLMTQNRELEVTNRELDRFVYSVSHDLSAPLKSILGLVNISRLSSDQRDHFDYIGKIESSVLKLESFIKEILDYSRDKRQEIYIEQIELKDLCTEILNNLRFLDGYRKIKLDITGLRPIQLSNERGRLKIIINNHVANAILFQKRIPEHDPFIKISSSQIKDKVIVEIEDNGEGIKQDLQSRIFDMFFRGTANSRGSGMGLYIAREAATKIDGRILVRSEYGKGSTFTVELKNITSN